MPFDLLSTSAIHHDHVIVGAITPPICIMIQTDQGPEVQGRRMTETPQADALLIDLISGTPRINAFAELTETHEREKALYILLALLTDPSWDLRRRATQALGAL